MSKSKADEDGTAGKWEVMLPSSCMLLYPSPLYCVGESHPEDVTTGWPTSWTQAIGGSLPPSMLVECKFCQLFLF